MSLYLKYRPTSFDEMQGDFSHLQSLIEGKDRPHTFLFTGGSGRGKTTLSRILAKMVGASEQDIQEINCSDHNGVDDMRYLSENMNLASFSKAKVYILDEAHKITDAGQNCLLKPLEDTPKHVYFILCSSEPNKIIKAIKTRATIIDFPPIDPDDIYALLKSVCKKEGVKVSGEVLDKIAELCDGSARQALVALETIIATPEDQRLDKVAASCYGTDSPEAIDLMRAIFAYASWKELSGMLKALKKVGADGEGLRRAVLGYGTAIMLNDKFNPMTVRMVDCFTDNVYDSGFNGFIIQCAKAYGCRKDVTEGGF